MTWQEKIEQLSGLTGVEKLLAIMAMLRDPEHGCPWDLKQTFASIVPHTIEEAYEVADAIEQGQFDELKKELGDLLFQVVFYAQLGQEQNKFDFEQIANAMCDKLISRHPHVFSNQSFANDEAIKRNWENLKAQERAQATQKSTSVLDDIPRNMPALSRAYKMQKRVSHVGFDWPDVHGALDKVSEEIEELKVELQDIETNKADIADELGDLYFALTNVTRHLGLKPEEVLRNANNKFERRFRGVEDEVVRRGKSVDSASLQELDAIWDLVKLQEKE